MSKICRNVSARKLPPAFQKFEIADRVFPSPIILSSGSSSSSLNGGDKTTPIRHIACLKKSDDLKKFEETEDCFILDFEPEDLISRFEDDDDDGDKEIVVVAEKGQFVVACKDYPHPRHLCLKFPFETSSHGSYCNMCYCYVCDIPAPCSKWMNPKTTHCHASEKIESWNILRRLQLGISKPNLRETN